MGSVKVGPDGSLKKESEELDYPMRDEHTGVRENGVLGGKEQRLCDEVEGRTNEQALDVNGETNGVVRDQSQSGAHTPPQQQPVGPAVRWDRFLPFQSLKVLLVENDDSTRQVVSALLRNCGYEVYNVTNGVQAWKLLEDLTTRIDLVLTEASMPCLSGIGLLCKIMSHKTRKNIPVIMMSSVDSMNLVFQCLSKGAADFLFKPVRKNELKNLWQHVWRRCHSSSGSASESGVPKSKSVNESDNNTGSNDENDNASIGLNTRDGSDNGSGTQSSWTKRAVEVESPQPMSPWKQLSERHDSTCAQVIHPRLETYGNEWVPESSKRDLTESKEFLDNSEMGRDLVIGMPTHSELHSYPRENAHIELPGLKRNKLFLQGLKNDKDILEEGALNSRINNHHGEERAQPADKIGAIASSDTIGPGVGPSETLTGPSMISEVKDKLVSDSKESASLDLSLKRLRSIKDGGTPHKDERNVLRHSDQSAFSRYNTANSSTHVATGCGGSCSVPFGNNSSEAIKPESLYNLASTSDAACLHQGSNGSSNNNDMESTTKNTFTKAATNKDKLTSMSGTTCAVHTSSAFRSVQNWHSCPPQKVVPEKVNDIVLAAAVGQPRGSHHQVQVQHHHYHYHHHRHHVHNMPQPPSQLMGHDDVILNSMEEVAPQCGSSNVFGGPMENNGNYSLNGSASGSNHGSNGQNGGSTTANNGALNVESDNGMAGKSGGGGSGIRHGSGVEQNRYAQREAALTKFRQKRKERCYEKKVRYQSRKKLAEQRPRVRGQFVRQTAQEQTDQDADS